MADIYIKPTPASIGAATSESPAFTGTPTAPTATLGTDTAQIATMAALKTAIDTRAELAHTFYTVPVTLGASSYGPIERQVIVGPSGAVFNNQTHLLTDEPNFFVLRSTTHTNQLNPNPGSDFNFSGVLRAFGVTTQIRSDVENPEYNVSFHLQEFFKLTTTQEHVACDIKYDRMLEAKGTRSRGWGLFARFIDHTLVKSSESGEEVRTGELNFVASGVDDTNSRYGLDFIVSPHQDYAGTDTEMRVAYRITTAGSYIPTTKPMKVKVGFHADTFGGGVNLGSGGGILTGFLSDSVEVAFRAIGSPAFAALDINTNNQAVSYMRSALSNRATSAQNYGGRTSTAREVVHSRVTNGFSNSSDAAYDGVYSLDVARNSALTEVLTFDFNASNDNPVYLFLAGALRNLTRDANGFVKAL